MDPLTIADALRLAINDLRDVAESHRMPSASELDEATSGMHANAEETLATLLDDLREHK